MRDERWMMLLLNLCSSATRPNQSVFLPAALELAFAGLETISARPCRGDRSSPGLFLGAEGSTHLPLQMERVKLSCRACNAHLSYQ